MVQIQFNAKVFVKDHHLLMKYHELMPVKEKSLTHEVSLSDNLIIHDDNIRAIKAVICTDAPDSAGNWNWR